MQKRLSVIIPAFNEEKNLEGSVKSVLKIAPKYCNDIEIIVINDGSKDKTGDIAEKLAKSNKKIKAFHNRKNMGMGYTYWRGVKHVKFEYTMLVWGDYAHTDQSLHQILSFLGEYDVIIPNYTNMATRTWQRRTISKLFTFVVNLIMGLSIKYYNGSTVYKSSYLKNFPRRSSGFGYQAEVLAYIIKQGATFKQVDVKRRNVPDGVTSAFRLDNIIDVGKTFLWLAWNLQIRQKIKYLFGN